MSMALLSSFFVTRKSVLSVYGEEKVILLKNNFVYPDKN